MIFWIVIHSTKTNSPDIYARGDALGIVKFDGGKDSDNWQGWQEIVKTLDEKFTRAWAWVAITQAEWETYRDLHGFEVFYVSPST